MGLAPSPRLVHASIARCIKKAWRTIGSPWLRSWVLHEYDSNPEKVKDTVLCRLANEPSYEYNTAFAEYRYNKNQKIKEYLKKNSKEIIQWLIDLSDEKRLIYFLQSGLVDKNDVGQIVDEILNSNLENKSVIAAYALNGQKTERKEENIAFGL